MATSQEIQTALSNEARRGELRVKIAKLQGSADATASLMQLLNSLNSDTAQSLVAAQGELGALVAGAGAGITADFGPKSSVTQMLEAERTAAMPASIDFVVANPACSEAEAAAAWDAAALATHPSFAEVLQPGLAVGRLYRANLVGLGAIAADTWEDQRGWILTTPKATILAM